MGDTKTPGLTGDQVRQFLDDGFFILQDLLPPAAVQPLTDELKQRVDEAARAAVEQGVLDSAHTFPDAAFETRLARICKACSQRNWAWKHYFAEQNIYDQVQKPRTPGMFTLRTWPSLLDVVESIVGPEVLAHPQFNIRTKLPDQPETVLPWHQDLAFLDSAEARDTLFVNLWIPLVDTTAANGCMQMMRGTHGMGLLPHDLRVPLPGGDHSVGIDEGDLPDCEIVTGELNVGDVLLTTERVLHRSVPNVSDTVRWSVEPDTAPWDCRPVVRMCPALLPAAAIIRTASRDRLAIGTSVSRASPHAASRQPVEDVADDPFHRLIPPRRPCHQKVPPKVTTLP